MEGDGKFNVDKVRGNRHRGFGGWCVQASALARAAADGSNDHTIEGPFGQPLVGTQAVPVIASSTKLSQAGIEL